MTKKVACAKCKHHKWFEYSGYMCAHPEVAKECFDPVHGSYIDYKDCISARNTVCVDGKYYEPSLWARITKKTN